MATDEALDEDPETYGRCDECPVAEHLDGLCVENRAAWQTYQQVVTRFTVDTHTTALVLRRVTEDLDAVAFEDLVERLSIVHDALHPPPEQKTDAT